MLRIALKNLVLLMLLLAFQGCALVNHDRPTASPCEGKKDQALINCEIKAQRAAFQPATLARPEIAPK